MTEGDWASRLGTGPVVGLRRGISVSIVEDGAEPGLGVVVVGVSLVGFLGGGGGSSLASAEENLLGDSGDESGEAGEVNVVTTAARDSPI